MNRNLRSAIIHQEGLIEYTAGQLRVAQARLDDATSRLEQDPRNLYLDTLRHETEMKISDLKYVLEVANESLQLMKEALHDE